MANAWEQQIINNKAKLMADPTWAKYLAEGRVSMPEDKAFLDQHFVWAQKSYNDQLARVKAQDKTIANYYELATGQKATPDTIAQYVQYADDPALLQAAISKGAATATPTGQFKDAITAAVQEKLGRAPTEAELGFFGKQMEAGAIDAYGLGEFLGGTTEYQTKASDTARTKLAGELGAVDESYLAKVQKQLESKYAARPGSSAFGSALIGAGKDLAKERTGYLAGLGYQDFQRGQESLTGAYQNRLSQMYNQNQNMAGLGSESRQRYYSQQDAAQQQAAQERLARLSQPKQGNFLQGLVPGLVSGGMSLAGAYLGRPTYRGY